MVPPFVAVVVVTGKTNVQSNQHSVEGEHEMANKDGFSQLLKQREFNAELAGLIGLLIGDALGVPYEFHSPESLPRRDEIEMSPPPWFNRSHPGVPPGTWSDDGSQALCLLASLLEQGRFSSVDFSAKLLQWLDTGYMAVNSHVFDVGLQTERALAKLRESVPPIESGGKDVYSNGNGSLMRVLPLALWHRSPDKELVRDAHLQSLPTHAHPRSMVACAFYCLVARGYLQKQTDPWVWADHCLKEVYESWPDHWEKGVFLHELNTLLRFPKTEQPNGTGYVINCLWSARKALEEKSFEKVVQAAIQFGHDTDTTAAVAGGLAGIHFGVRGIPERWLKQLRGFDLIEPLIPSFLIELKRI